MNRTTPVRKRHSPYNATKHGIFAGIILRGDVLGESEETFRELLSGLRNAINPVDQVENVQVEKLAFLYLRLSRLYLAEWDAAPKLFECAKNSLDEEEPRTETIWVDKGNETVIVRKVLAPDLLVRYEANVERQIARTINLLEQWRRIRVGVANTQGTT